MSVRRGGRGDGLGGERMGGDGMALDLWRGVYVYRYMLLARVRKFVRRQYKTMPINILISANLRSWRGSSH